MAKLPSDNFENFTLASAIEDTVCWKSEVLCDGFRSKEESVISSGINICNLMTKTQSYGFPHCQSNFRFDPTSFKGVGDIDDIKNYVLQQCKKAGFSASSCNTRKKKRGYRLGAADICCKHRKFLKENETPKYKTTKAVSKETQCPFQIRIFCHEDDEFWYLSCIDNKGCHPGLHKGHCFIPPDHLMSTSKEINDEDIEEFQFFSFVQSNQKDLLKAVEGNVEMQAQLKKDLIELQVKYAAIQRNASKNTVSEVSKLVSLNSVTKTATSSKRKRRLHEYC